MRREALVRLRRSVLTCLCVLAVVLPGCRPEPKPPSVEELLEALAGPDERKSGEARLALITLGEPAVPGLVVMLGAPQATLRVRAASTLWMLAEKAKGAVPALVAALDDPDVEVRRSVAMALGNMGGHALPAVPALARALADRDGSVRQYAAKALGAIGPGAEQALPALRELTRTDALRATAEEAIARIQGAR